MIGKVSVLIVSYNAEKYIEKTIESCIGQTYENIEVLLLDNASKDKTVEIVKRIQARDSRLKIFESKENLGPYGGLNFLLEKAEGGYVAIQDHDDIWFSEKIEKQVEFLEKNQKFIACGTNTYYYYESKGVLILSKKPFETDFVDHTSLMFRNGGFRYDTEHNFADEHFEKNILKKHSKIACIQEGLTVHRIKKDGTNLSSSRFSFEPKKLQDFFSVNYPGIKTFLYILNLLAPFDLMWIVWNFSKYIKRNGANWISYKSFIKKYNINL